MDERLERRVRRGCGIGMLLNFALLLPDSAPEDVDPVV